MFKPVLTIIRQTMIFLIAGFLFIGIFSAGLFLFLFSSIALIFNKLFMRKTPANVPMSFNETWLNARLLVMMII
ncbi:hypothetical protein [Exercitatus varius]|uniref:hypothetical protein n=1 Tax=Exercitatus varius TaxID=67857 RepID=UPI00294AA712|nr:hypothetical protein [Exercitatus varius]MDG2958351.1 hypothetical protein [Exercitatus varius]